MDKKATYIKFAFIALILIIAYIPTFKWMSDRWNARDTYYSHGILVPFISFFIIWTKRHLLQSLKLNPSGLGWLFFIPAILIHALSISFKVSFSSGFSLIFVLIGLILLSFGKEFLRQLLFPVLFLAFMIPLPEVAIVNLSFRLKIFAAQVSTFIINKVGVPAVREGSIIRTAHAQLMVEDPCSGIRSLIALIALGALMAYFSNLSKVKKTILF
ncbi:MAG: exosortase/archaeosortase family protein, partial [Candidatus Omnitrophota bacterium]